MWAGGPSKLHSGVHVQLCFRLSVILLIHIAFVCKILKGKILKIKVVKFSKNKISYNKCTGRQRKVPELWWYLSLAHATHDPRAREGFLWNEK